MLTQDELQEINQQRGKMYEQDIRIALLLSRITRRPLGEVLTEAEQASRDFASEVAGTPGPYRS